MHTGYIRDTHSEYMQDTYLWGYGERILCVMYLRVKIQCILNVFSMYPECIVNISLGKIHFIL